MIALLVWIAFALQADAARRYTVFRSPSRTNADITLTGFGNICNSTAASLGYPTSTGKVFPIIAGRAEIAAWDDNAEVFLLGNYLTTGANFRNGIVDPQPFAIYDSGPDSFGMFTGLSNGWSLTPFNCASWTTQFQTVTVGNVVWDAGGPQFSWASSELGCSAISYVMCAYDATIITQAPTTRAPSAAPSRTPTTSRPTRSPIVPTPETSFPTASPFSGTRAPFPYPAERTAYIYPSRSVTILNVTQMDLVCRQELPPGFLEHVEASRSSAFIHAFLDLDTRPLALLSNVTKFRTLTDFASIAGSLDEFLNMRHPFGTQLTAIGAPCANCRNWTSTDPNDLMMLGFSRIRQYADSCAYLPNTTYLCVAVADVDPFTPMPTLSPEQP
jgi:hypothetical protein